MAKASQELGSHARHCIGMYRPMVGFDYLAGRALYNAQETRGRAKSLGYWLGHFKASNGFNESLRPPGRAGHL